MPWKPSTDFEEEIVNLQPNDDFIFGFLSEPESQPFYPRPISHIEYAATKKLRSKQRQVEYEETGILNDRLHVISQVQRIAGTKPLGQHATVDDWANDKDNDVEKEVIAMMRHFGLGPSVEQPLNEKVTIATYPVKKSVEVMKNGRKKVPLFFDENLFKLKPKNKNSSSGFESESSNSLKDKNIEKIPPNCHESSSEISSSSCDASFNSFHTANNSNGSDTSLAKYRKAQEDRHALLLQAERMHNYDKLHEEYGDDEDVSTRFFQQFPSIKQKCYKTALNESMSSISDSGTNTSCLNTDSSESISYLRHRGNNDNNRSFDSSNTNSSKTSSTTSSSSFLQRFLKTDEINDSAGTSSIGSFASNPSSSTPILPLNYANVAKHSLKKSKVAANFGNQPLQSSGTTSSGLIQPPDHIRFCTPRELYERKRHNHQ